MTNTINNTPTKSTTVTVGYVSSVKLTPSGQIPQRRPNEPNVIREGIVMPSIPDITTRPSIIPVESPQEPSQDNGSIDAKK